MRHEEGGFSAGSVLLSFLLGGMVGAGIALLMAPQSGAETRRKIRKMADETKEKAADYISHAKEMVSSTIEKGKSIYEEKKSAITAAMEAGKEAYEKEVHK
jgi:gas vesicle protein